MSKAMAQPTQPTLFLEPGERHPKWGYDLDRVPSVRCLLCGHPIGDEAYAEETTLARFGQMLFVHKRCRDSEGRS